MKDRAISLNAVKDILKMANMEEFDIVAYRNIMQLPSVKPQEPKYCDRNICLKNEYNGIGCDECEVTKSQEPKTGHWKVVSDGYGDNAYICECSECKDTVWVYKDADRKWNYCPNCGAKMVEPQESEDKK